MDEGNKGHSSACTLMIKLPPVQEMKPRDSDNMEHNNYLSTSVANQMPQTNPEIICITCEAPVTQDDAIKCGICQEIRHRRCDFDLDDDATPPGNYVCDTCILFAGENPDIDPVNVRETELKKREETLLRKEAELNKREFEIQEGISHVATLKSFVSQLEKKVEAIQEENCRLRVQIHDLTQTTAGEDQSMAADTGAAIIPQLMASVASLTSCVSSINLRLDKIEATLQGEQPRKNPNQDNTQLMSSIESLNSAVSTINLRLGRIDSPRSDKRETLDQSLHVVHQKQRSPPKKKPAQKVGTVSVNRNSPPLNKLNEIHGDAVIQGITIYRTGYNPAGIESNQTNKQGNADNKIIQNYEIPDQSKKHNSSKAKEQEMGPNCDRSFKSKTYYNSKALQKDQTNRDLKGKQQDEVQLGGDPSSSHCKNETIFVNDLIVFSDSEDQEEEIQNMNPFLWKGGFVSD